MARTGRQFLHPERAQHVLPVGCVPRIVTRPLAPAPSAEAQTARLAARGVGSRSLESLAPCEPQTSPLQCFHRGRVLLGRPGTETVLLASERLASRARSKSVMGSYRLQFVEYPARAGIHRRRGRLPGGAATGHVPHSAGGAAVYGALARDPMPIAARRPSESSFCGGTSACGQRSRASGKRWFRVSVSVVSVVGKTQCLRFGIRGGQTLSAPEVMRSSLAWLGDRSEPGLAFGRSSRRGHARRFSASVIFPTLYCWRWNSGVDGWDAQPNRRWRPTRAWMKSFQIRRRSIRSLIVASWQSSTAARRSRLSGDAADATLRKTLPSRSPATCACSSLADGLFRHGSSTAMRRTTAGRSPEGHHSGIAVEPDPQK